MGLRMAAGVLLGASKGLKRPVSSPAHMGTDDGVVGVISFSRQGGTVGWLWNFSPCPLGTSQSGSQPRQATFIPPRVLQRSVFAGRIRFLRNSRRVQTNAPTLETRIFEQKATLSITRILLHRRRCQSNRLAHWQSALILSRP